MNPYRILLLLVPFFICAGFVQAQSRNPEWAVPVTTMTVENMHKIDEGVYRSGQPTSENFSQLYGYGIREILNLRNWNSDDDEVKDVPLVLHRLKMRASKVSDENIVQALQMIKNRTGPILIHCWHGSDRTGAVSAMYRIIFQGWSKEQAIDEMMNGGYGFHSIYGNIPRYINNADIEELKVKVESLK